MEREDDTTTDRAADTTTGDHTRDERPSGPSQPGEGGFEEGAEQTPDSQRTPDFARGVHEEDDDTGEVEGRYSRGAEARGTEEASKEGRFSEGIEQRPHDRD